MKRGGGWKSPSRWIRAASSTAFDYANLLIRMNKNKDAVQALQLAVKMAHTPEQTAAAENVLQTLHRLESNWQGSGVWG